MDALQMPKHSLIPNTKKKITSVPAETRATCYTLGSRGIWQEGWAGKLVNASFIES